MEAPSILLLSYLEAYENIRIDIKIQNIRIQNNTNHNTKYDGKYQNTKII